MNPVLRSDVAAEVWRFPIFGLKRWWTAALVACCLSHAVAFAATELRLLLPLNRTTYQDNEWIDVSAVRTATEDLSSRELALKLTGGDGSELRFVFPVADVEAGARTVTIVHLGNLAYWNHRKLKWDPQYWQFVGGREADAWMDRPRRDPWQLPAA